MTRRYAALLTFTLAVTGACVQADETNRDPHAHHKRMLSEQAAPNGDTTTIQVPAAELLNQDGVRVTLTDDVIADNIAVVDFVYTTCTTVCPVLSAVFKQVQAGLEDRLGRDVVMVSITVDPTRDTPEKLKRYAEKFGAGNGWVWLTGEQQIVSRVLQEFGTYTPNFEDHPSVVLVGDGRSGQWSRFLGFPAAERIIEKVNEISARRLAQQAQAERKE